MACSVSAPLRTKFSRLSFRRAVRNTSPSACASVSVSTSIPRRRAEQANSIAAHSYAGSAPLARAPRALYSLA